MTKPLKIVKSALFNFVDGLKADGANPKMSGNCTGLRGNCTGLRGNCSDLSGDLDEIPADERPAYIRNFAE